MKSFLHHHVERFLLAHVTGVNRLIDDRIANDAEPHFELLHFHLRPAVTGFRHDLLGIHGPALDEGSALENRPHQSGRLEFVGMRELQVMAGHRFVDGKVAHHEVVVLPEEGILALLVPVVRRRSHGEERLSVLLQRPG